MARTLVAARAETTDAKPTMQELFRLADIVGADDRACVRSSAVLSIVVARAFGLEADAGVASGRVFAQVRLPDGRSVPIETISPVEPEPATDEIPGDDQPPRIIPAYLLVAMAFETVPPEAPVETRDRMQEIAGALAYEQRDLVFDRLNVWEREGARLARQTDAIALLRLGRMSEPALADAEARFPDDEGITALVREQRRRTAQARAALSR